MTGREIERTPENVSDILYRIYKSLPDETLANEQERLKAQLEVVSNKIIAISEIRGVE